MSKLSCLVTPALACFAVLLAGMMGRPTVPQAAQPPRSPFVADSPPADARRLLDDLIANLAPSAPSRNDGVDWLQMTVWQKMDDGITSFETDTRYQRGPQRRLRLDMEVHARRPVKITIVCDGSTLRESVCVAGRQPTVRSLRLPAVTDPAGTERVLQEHGVPDLVGLLKSLRDGLKNAVQENGRWHDRPVIRISGDWTPNADLPADMRPL